MNPSYGLTRTFANTSLADARGRITDALKTEGFGILTEIDVQATMKKKLDVDFQPYQILGACNPSIAHQALTADPAIGLMLPCNVVVTETGGGDAIVSIAKPEAMFSVVDNPAMKPFVAQVSEKLTRALELA